MKHNWSLLCPHQPAMRTKDCQELRIEKRKQPSAIAATRYQRLGPRVHHGECGMDPEIRVSDATLSIYVCYSSQSQKTRGASTGA